MKCARCESVGRKPRRGTHEMIGPNGIRTVICNACYNELLDQEVIYFMAARNRHEKSESKKAS